MSASPGPTPAAGSDRGFLICLAILGGSYVVLIVAMLAADLQFTTTDIILRTFKSEEIRYAIKLSLVSCTITTVLALWVAVPLGYLLSRFEFRGKEAVDTVLDIPIVLPPLVIGLSLLILFQTWPGRQLELLTSKYLGFALTYVALPLLVLLVFQLMPLGNARLRLLGGVLIGAIVAALLYATIGQSLAGMWQRRLGTDITYAVPSVILAQFSVATAFAVRTMRVTFDQISPRTEKVALTLGCSRFQAFWMVTLPQARRGVLTAATLAWARSLGEFGPILVFAGATRMRTEVLSTSVFLELNIGNLEAAMAVSLLMVVVAVLVLVLMRVFGLRGTGLI